MSYTVIPEPVNYKPLFIRGTLQNGEKLEQ